MTLAFFVIQSVHYKKAMLLFSGQKEYSKTTLNIKRSVETPLPGHDTLIMGRSRLWASSSTVYFPACGVVILTYDVTI